MSYKLILDIICYSGTAFTLLSYCFRTLKLRIFLLCGNTVNIIWAILDHQIPILISNILYLIINIFGLFKELNVNKTKQEFRKLSPYYEDGLYKCLGYSAKTEKELIEILKNNGNI